MKELRDLGLSLQFATKNATENFPLHFLFMLIPTQWLRVAYW